MKNFLIIGASSGIGLQLAKNLSASNHVIGTYHESSVTELENVSYQSLNVLDETLELEDLPDQLDGLVYCPGSINLLPFKRIHPNDYLDDFQLQVLGAIKVIQASLSRLKKSEQASIVLFSSVAASMGFNYHTQVSVSKGAIEGLTKSLAAELSPSIRINAIAPSLTDTPLAAKMLNTDKKVEANAERHPLKRIGSSSDIAQTAEFLLSSASSWMTGQVLHVDGGMSSIRG